MLAAAIRDRADLIVTANIKDFPRKVVEPLGLEAITVDEFLMDQLDLGPDATIQVLEEQTRQMRRPPVKLPDLLDRLARSGAPKFARAVRVAIQGTPAGSQRQA